MLNGWWAKKSKVIDDHPTFPFRCSYAGCGSASAGPYPAQEGAFSRRAFAMKKVPTARFQATVYELQNGTW